MYPSERPPNLSFFGALRSAPLAVSLVTPEGQWLWSSDYYLKMLSPRETRISPQNNQELLDLVLATAAWTENLKPVILHTTDPQGNPRTLSVIAENVEIENNRAGVSLYGTDITPQYVAKEKKAEADAALNTLINSFDDIGILITDADQTILAVSDLVLRISGISAPAEDIIGISFFALLTLATNYTPTPDVQLQTHAVTVGASTEWPTEPIILRDGTVIRNKYVPVFVDGVLVRHIYLNKVVSTPKSGF